ncbi:TcpE family conjugal transfer membrane protein [Nonomuraea sp. KM88]|uniref:TcpE family conjugal transfer membrane protein n=1 Tax=Nonomuraea sp. KM88 TaxID=3457427 RepID=UPI003FCC819C
MDLPTYTNIWRIEKRLYKLYDLRLPMPLPIVWIGVFVGVFVPWSLLLVLVGVPVEMPWHVLFLVPPGIVTWLSTRPVIEGKRLTELLESQLRYLGQPRAWYRLAPGAEPETVTFSARVWRATPARVKAKKPRKARQAQRRREGQRTTGPRQVRPVVAAAAAAAAQAPVGEQPGARPGWGTRRGTAPALKAQAHQAPPSPARGTAGGAIRREKGLSGGAERRHDRSPVPSPGSGAPEPGDRRTSSGETDAEARAARDAVVPIKTAESRKPVAGKPIDTEALRRLRRLAASADAPAGTPEPAPAERPRDDARPDAGDDARDGARHDGGQRRDGGRHEDEVARDQHRKGQPPRLGPALVLKGTQRIWPPLNPDAKPLPRPATPTDDRAAGTSTGAAPAGDDRTRATPTGAHAGDDRVGASATEDDRAETVPTAPDTAKADDVPPAAAGDAPGAADVPPVAAGDAASEEVDSPSEGAVARGSGDGTPAAVPPRAGDAAQDVPDAVGVGSRSAKDEEAGNTSGQVADVREAPGTPQPSTRGQAVGRRVRPTLVPVDGPGPGRTTGEGRDAPGFDVSRERDAPAPATAGGRDAPAPGTAADRDAPAARARDARVAGGRGGQRAAGREAPPLRSEPGRGGELVPPVPGPRPGEGRVRRVESVVGRDSGGWRRIAQVVVGGGGVRTDGSEIDEARARAVFSGSRRVVVLGCTGGAGQSTTALMLGHTFARYRDDRVVAVDANTGGSTLTSKIELETPETLTSLLSGLDRVSGYLAMRGYTTRTASGLEVISADTDAGAEQRLADRSLFSDHRLGESMRLLDRHYKLAVIDPAAALAARVLPYADQLVLVVPASEEASEAVAMTYEWLDGHGCAELRRRAVMVVNGVSRRSMADVEQAEAVARGRCRAIVRVPWEDDLAPGGAEVVDPGQLRAAGRRAYLALAGVVIAGFAAQAQTVRPSEEELASDPPGTRIGER